MDDWLWYWFKNHKGLYVEGPPFPMQLADYMQASTSMYVLRLEWLKTYYGWGKKHPSTSYSRLARVPPGFLTHTPSLFVYDPGMISHLTTIFEGVD